MPVDHAGFVRPAIRAQCNMSHMNLVLNLLNMQMQTHSSIPKV